ncbi:acyltransferase [Rhodanobacter sp. MP7CTX1]|jgi:acetyltransferase-like isoleucine patch superfamily enzyme|uniref:acyltransferase n=1 Tax=Rhodanobacter sp. MP7CTX1 TaxID=2723084 RepID=UPI0016082501|nr:acyltransferase [Rhodanobacter sp. MP7CTX1]MBB6186261.1 galactoside O-acetyltransferase [Rhodanobacter sp. MP7CTX1]
MSLINPASFGFRQLGRNVRIYSGAKIIGAEFITLGDNVIIDDFVLIYARAPTIIGSHVHIASFCSLVGGGELRIGDFCSLSSGVRVLTGSDDFLGGGLTNSTIPTEFRHVTRSHVHIGRHAMIGVNTVLLPGVSIGEGAAVGAGSLVNRELAPWGVYVGSPARQLRERPSEQVLAQEVALQAAHPFQCIA